MTMKKYIVEEKLTKKSIGTVISIVYNHPIGPNHQHSLPLYVVVNFPQCTLDHPFIEGFPSIYILIPATTNRCEEYCCSITTIPLRLCSAITMYKIQGITIGPG